MTNVLVNRTLSSMSAVNIYDAKTQFSRLIRRVRAGEEIVIADHGEPVARLVPIASPEGPRLLGGDEDAVIVMDDFDAPLPETVVAAFYPAPKAAAVRKPLRRGVGGPGKDAPTTAPKGKRGR